MSSPRILIVKNVTREGPGLIGKILETHSIPCDLVDLDQGDPFPELESYHAMIVLGGPDSANDKTPKMLGELDQIRAWTASGRPYLGICLGLQLLVKASGGSVVKAVVKEVGFRDIKNDFYRVELTEDGRADPLFRDFDQSSFRVFQLHGETVEAVAGMTLLGFGRHCRHQVARLGQKAYGVQCHFELTREMFLSWLDEDDDLRKLPRESVCRDFDAMAAAYTADGEKLIRNFLALAGCLKKSVEADSR